MNKDKLDFLDFINSDSSDQPSPKVQQLIYHSVWTDLHPALWKILIKIALVQGLVSAGLLQICPQFGIGGTQHSFLLHFLMQWGSVLCHIFCGSLFIGSTLLSAVLILSTEELQYIRKNRLLTTSFTIGLFFGSLLCLGAQIEISVFLFWSLGAFIAALGSIEGGWLARRFRIKIWI